MMKALLVTATLLLNAFPISQGSNFPLKAGKPGHSKLPIDPLEGTQPQSIDDCDQELQRPTKRDLNERRLRRRLGGTIDERFLSITEPLLSSGKYVKRVSLRGISTIEKNYLREIIRNETVPNLGKPSLFMERFMMKWLIQKSDCPVEHIWKDLGFCYWPRWISLGSCVNKECSWPPGMSCVPSKPTPVYLLRWLCKSRPGKKARRGADGSHVYCRWLKFSYPVVNECRCNCKTANPRVVDHMGAAGNLLPYTLLQGQ